MTDKDYMLLAIREAKKSTQPIPCGCTIIKYDQLLATAFNSQRADSDPTAHAEIKAIRQAGKQHGRNSLKGATAYCTCEPCLMCLSALIQSGVRQLYFGVRLADLVASDNRFNVPYGHILDNSSWKMTVTPNFMHNTCIQELYT